MTARTSARSVDCPTCGIKAPLPCRSTTTGRSNTDTHKARHEAAAKVKIDVDGPLFGELCAGYGGIGMGAQTVLGGRLAWYAEWDDDPSRIMAHHHPGVENYRDVTAIDWHNVPRVDVLTAGFPCQPFSHAGKRLGANDERHLWPHIARGIAIMRPQLVILENVRGLASGQGEPDTDEIVALDARRQHIDRALVVIERRRRKAIRENATRYIRQHTDDGHRLMVERRRVVARAKRARAELARALATVLGDLADIGYDAQWYGLRAADVGAPHGRFRFFIYAWPADAPSDPRWIGYGDGGAAAAYAGRIGGREGQGERPGPGAETGRRETGRTSRRGDLRSADDDLTLLPTPTAADGKRVAVSKNARDNYGGTTLGEQAVENAQDWGEYGPAIRRWEAIIGRPAPSPTEIGPKGQPRLSPRFVEWMMGLPAGHVTDPAIWDDGRSDSNARNAQLKALGNGVVPPQCAAATAVFVQDMRAEYAPAAAVSA